VSLETASWFILSASSILISFLSSSHFTHVSSLSSFLPLSHPSPTLSLPVVHLLIDFFFINFSVWLHAVTKLLLASFSACVVCVCVCVSYRIRVYLHNFMFTVNPWIQARPWIQAMPRIQARVWLVVLIEAGPWLEAGPQIQVGFQKLTQLVSLLSNCLLSKTHGYRGLHLACCNTDVLIPAVPRLQAGDLTWLY